MIVCGSGRKQVHPDPSHGQSPNRVDPDSTTDRRLYDGTVLLHGANQTRHKRTRSKFTHVQQEVEGRNEPFPSFLAAPEINIE